MADYAQLLVDIPNYMMNDTLSQSGTYAATVTGSIIPSAEFRVSRDLRVAGYQTQATGTFTAGQFVFDRPADLVSLDVLLVTDPSGNQVPLQLKQIEYLYEYIANGAAPGQPKYYATKEAAKYAIAPLPAIDTDWELNYTRRLAPLSALNLTNWTTINAYDCLLAASLAEAARFVQDDRQNTLIQMWENKYDTLVKAINDAETRADRDDYRVPFVQSENM